MSTTTIQSSLGQIESLLATLVGGGGRVTKKMRAPEFVHYAHMQIVKAMGEPAEASTQRLKALHASVSVFKDNFTDDEAVDVPVYVNDVTAMDDKSSQLTAATAAASGGGGDQSAFAQGFVAKIAGLRQAVDAILKDLPADDDDAEKSKKADAGDADAEDDEEAEEKRKAAAAAKGDDAEDTEKAKGKAPPFPPPPPPKKGEPPTDEKEKAAKRVAKGLDVSRDGTQWPSDLNDPAFVKDGTVTKSLDWGSDPR